MALIDELEIVDAHHHLWDLKPGHYPGLGDRPVPTFMHGDYYAPLKRDYLPADYRRDAAGLKIIATVHVEAERDRDCQVAETKWLHTIHAQHGMPHAVVAHAWIDQDDSEEILIAHKRHPLVRGIRTKPVIAPDAGSRPPGAQRTLQDPKWRAGLRLLEKHDLSWDLRVPYWHLEEAAEVCRELPGLRIVLNHTGFPWDRSEEGLAHWRAGMRALARCPNVWCKISELGLRDTPWTIEGNRRVVLEAIDMFGIERSMFASNYPVAGLHVGYRAQIEGMLTILSGLKRGELDRVFRDSAATFYRIPLPRPL